MVDDSAVPRHGEESLGFQGRHGALHCTPANPAALYEAGNAGETASVFIRVVGQGDEDQFLGPGAGLFPSPKGCFEAHFVSSRFWVKDSFGLRAKRGNTGQADTILRDFRQDFGLGLLLLGFIHAVSHRELPE